MEKDLTKWKGVEVPHRKLMQGRWVIMEPLDPATHGDALYELSTDELTEGMRIDRGTREEFEKWMVKKTQDTVIHAVIDRASGRVSGRQSFSQFQTDDGVVELSGVVRGPLIARKPAATEAIYLSLSHLFDELGYRRVEWRCFTSNGASNRAAQRFGFVFEGILRRHHVVRGGNRDTALYAIVDSDWPNVKEAFEKWLHPDNFDDNGIQKKKLEDCRPHSFHLSTFGRRKTMENELADWKGCRRPGRKPMEGQYVRLEPFDSNKHTNELYEASQGLTRYMFDDPGTREDFQKWMQQAEKSEEKIFFAVVDKKSGKVGGRQMLFRIDEYHGVLEFGGILRGPLLAKTPASTEAIYLFLCYVFDELGYRRVEWKCDTNNIASRKAALRFGFTPEGIFRQHFVLKGFNRDTAWFSMIDKEWPQLKMSYERWLRLENFDNYGVQLRTLGEYICDQNK